MEIRFRLKRIRAENNPNRDIIALLYENDFVQGVGQAAAGFAIAAAVSVYIWDSRGAPIEKIGSVKYVLNRCGYSVSGLMITKLL